MDAVKLALGDGVKFTSVRADPPGQFTLFIQTLHEGLLGCGINNFTPRQSKICFCERKQLIPFSAVQRKQANGVNCTWRWV